MTNWYPVHEAFELAMTPTRFPPNRFLDERHDEGAEAAFRRALARRTPFENVEMRLVRETFNRHA